MCSLLRVAVTLLGRVNGGWGQPGKPKQIQSNADSCVSFASSVWIFSPADPVTAEANKLSYWTDLPFHCLFTVSACSLVPWQNGACRGEKLQQGTYITQSLREELMELHDYLNYFPLGLPLHVQNFQALHKFIIKFLWFRKPKGLIPKLNIVSSARRRLTGLDHEEARENHFCLKWGK